MEIKYDHLLGKEFVHGKDDCYELLRRFYKDNFNISLTDYARPNDWWVNEEYEFDLYKENYANEGFTALDDVPVRDLRIGDVLLIALPDGRRVSKVLTNHCAVYVGDGYIIHHRLGKLSEKILYRSTYKNFTTHVLRHKDVPDLGRKHEKELNLMDYILPHKRDRYLGVMNDRNGKTDEAQSGASEPVQPQGD